MKIALIWALALGGPVFGLSAADTQQDSARALAGQWIAYHWDGEGAPVRLELEIRVADDRKNFTGILRQQGDAPRYFDGSVGASGARDSDGQIQIELIGQGESLVELRRKSSYTTMISFWKE
ncbi:MAG: hypothetical protein NXI24_18470 [bacterium]|nr:hypothetical protein [bacterium]